MFIASFASFAQYSLCGTYKCIRPSFLQEMRLNMKGIKGGAIAGSEVILNPDSTFQYTTCGNILKGNWKIENKTVYLICISNKYLIDSLNNNFQRAALLGNVTIPFQLKGKKLYQIHNFGDGAKSIELLKKQE
jgi:hypothetical protein